MREKERINVTIAIYGSEKIVTVNFCDTRE